MRAIAALASLALLASCQSPAKIQAADAKFCRSIGAGQGPAYTQCMMQRDAMNRQDRQARLSRSAAMMVAGAQIMATPQPRPVTTTTCRRVGQQVVCSSL